MDFTLYNTLTRLKERFVPLNEDEVSIYSCGPTVHNYAHIGNLRKYIMDDILVKALAYAGYPVKHVMNITDVGHLESDMDEGEDKMLLSMLREKQDATALARRYEDSFFDDCAKLNIRRPAICCRATEHIGDMIALIRRLIELGYTYGSNGNIYFDVSRFKSYHQFAKLKLDEMRPGSRITVDPNKRSPFDFVLWFTKSKFENHIFSWDSPWGRGYPGWHIECSAMALKYLGERLDIHTGGIDHIPVHHTNEIAQSEAALGHKWVNYWVHSEFLVVEGAKMSKSAGEFLTLQKLCDQGFSPMDYRLFCLQSRYRQQLTLRFSSIQNAKDTLNSLYAKIAAILDDGDKEPAKKNCTLVNEYEDAFRTQICDDLNMPNALTVLYDVLKDPVLTGSEKKNIIQQFDEVLSLDLLNASKPLSSTVLPDVEIEALIAQRNSARAEKDYAAADRYRAELAAHNIILTDTAEGTLWNYKA